VEPLEDVLLIKKSLLEIEKEAAVESAKHAKIKSPTRSELHMKYASAPMPATYPDPTFDVCTPSVGVSRAHVALGHAVMAPLLRRLTTS
jgi:hypothetical protein